jgi:hypothetical protein
MRIIIAHDGSPAHFFDRSAIFKVLQYSGHQPIWWECKQKSVYDIFAEQGPFDLFYGQTYNLCRATIGCIENNSAMRVILRAGEWGIHTDNWTRETKSEYPILIESQKIKDLVLKLKDNTGKPDFLHTHYHENYLGLTHGHWVEKGIPVISLKNASDLFDYTNGIWRDEFASNVLYVGSNWEYKSRNLNPFILPLCNPQLKLKIKIFGQSGWGCGQFMGPAPQEIVKHLFKSAAINLAISEPHSTRWGYDITEKIFKLTSNRSFVISDKVEGLTKIYGDSVICADSPSDLLEKVLYYLANPDKKMKFIKKAYDITLANHTYFDRCATIFQQYGLDFEVKKVMSAKERLIKEMGL